jgi:hypothetical protein
MTQDVHLLLQRTRQFRKQANDLITSGRELHDAAREATAYTMSLRAECATTMDEARFRRSTRRKVDHFP